MSTLSTELTIHDLEAVRLWGPLHVGPALLWSPMGPLPDWWTKFIIKWAVGPTTLSTNTCFWQPAPWQFHFLHRENYVLILSARNHPSPRDHLIYRYPIIPSIPKIWSFSIIKTWTGYWQGHWSSETGNQSWKKKKTSLCDAFNSAGATISA